MDPMEVGDFITKLQTAVIDNPERAKEVIAEIKEKVAGLDPDSRAKVADAMDDLRARAANLPEDQKAQLQDVVATLRS